MITSTQPRTSLAVLNWRPTLSFFGGGAVGALKALDAEKRVLGFRVGEDYASALLKPTAQLMMAPDALTLSETNGALDRETVASVVTAALDALAPRVTTFVVHLQHVGDVGHLGSYDDARRVASRRLFGDLAGKLGQTDFAVLLDATNEGVEYQTEFGIISREEAPVRLTRFLSRVQGGRGESDPRMTLGQGLYDPAPEFPQVGLYVESRWQQAGATPSDHLVEWVLTELGRGEVRAAALVEQLLDVITEEQANNEGDGLGESTG